MQEKGIEDKTDKNKWKIQEEEKMTAEGLGHFGAAV